MHIDQFREYCLKKPYVTEELPFGPDVLVFKVAGKMFALCPIDNFDSINLKCDPETAVELREQYSGIKPGYHMNQQLWNTVSTDGSVPESLILELTNHSYELVWNSLPKKLSKSLQ